LQEQMDIIEKEQTTGLFWEVKSSK
jgi:hypothetical protein